MTDNNKNRNKEKEEFKLACDQVQTANDNKCLAIIKDYNKKKKEVII